MIYFWGILLFSLFLMAVDAGEPGDPDYTVEPDLGPECEPRQ